MDDDPWLLDDPLTTYLDAVHTVSPLSRDEEIDCVHHVRAGDQQAASAGKRLMEANLLLVVSIAERYRNAPIAMLDLIQQGNEGLMRAIRTLNESGEDSFSVHATVHIERAIAEIVGPSDLTGV